MIGVTEILLLFYLVLFPIPSQSSAYPQCTGSRSPFTLDAPLKFCKHNKTSCCDSDKDLQLQKDFEAMDIINDDCASVIKLILCSMCDQFSADLFQIDFTLRDIPALCNSIDAKNERYSMNGAATEYCTKVREMCANIPIFNSPFIASLKNKASPSIDPLPSMLKDTQWSNSSFCETFGNSSACSNEKMASFSNSGASSPPTGLCLEKISNGAYINMVPHPDGSNRVFVSNQQGKIWLGTIPEVGSNIIMGIDELNPFVDLSDQVLFGTEYGVMGMALHPNFARNGRFFISFNCDKFQQLGCQGRCACNTDVNCDPAYIVPDNGVEPCQYHTAIGEFTANVTATKHSMILFGPKDGYLYVMTGDGSHRDDPYNFALKRLTLNGSGSSSDALMLKACGGVFNVESLECSLGGAWARFLQRTLLPQLVLLASIYRLANERNFGEYLIAIIMRYFS